MFSTVINAWCKNKYLTIYWLNLWQYKHIDKTNLVGITSKLIKNKLFEYFGYQFIITYNQTDDLHIGIFTLSPIIKTFDDSNDFCEELYNYFNISYPTIQVNNELIPLWDYDFIKDSYVYIVTMKTYEHIKDDVEIFTQRESPFKYTDSGLVFIWNNKPNIGQYRFCQDINKRIGITMYNMYINEDDINDGIIDPFLINDMSDYTINDCGDEDRQYRCVVYTHYDSNGNIYLKNGSFIKQLMQYTIDVEKLLAYGELKRLKSIEYYKDIDITFKSNDYIKYIGW